MSDRIAVLNAGQVEQYAAPETVYHAPVTEFVARFIILRHSARAGSGIAR